ncbi:hypothetical protein [Azotosporobacter soli]|uniref:hypothetical protein n=1 Tax=Azotosporobacter soli TaxID=3055040 RepID=UPI0031FF350A
MIGELGAELLKQIYLAEQTKRADLKEVGETIADSVGRPRLAETVQNLQDYGLMVAAQCDAAERQEDWNSLAAAHVTPRGLSVLCHLGIL